MLPSFWLVVLLAAGRSASPQDTLPTAQEVRGLTAAQAAEQRPVKLTGVVTYVNPRVRDFFVQDATAGVYVRPSPHAVGVKHGDLVSVEGVTEAGAFAPCITPQAVRVTGKGRLPDPIPFALSLPESRWLDAQWVYAWVVVRGVTVSGGFTEVRVHATNGIATLRIPDPAAATAFRQMIDRAVPVRGVCVPQSRDRVVVGPSHIYVQSVPATPVGSPPPQKSGSPARVIADLFQDYTPSPLSGQRQVKVVGVVTASPYSSLLFVQDETGGVVVRMPPRETAPLHSRVEVEGVVQVDGRRVGLSRVRVRVLGPAAPVVPVNVTPDALAEDGRNAELVRIEGRLESIHAVGRWTELTLTDRAHRIAVFVPGGASLPIGARVSAVGVVTVHHPDGKSRSSSAVVSRTAADVTLLEPPAAPPPMPPPPYWTAARATGLFSGLGLVGVLAGAWVFSLRGRVKRAAALIQKQYDDRAELESQLRQATKLEAVGRLAGGIAHDFNNLLTVINGSSELLAALPPSARTTSDGLLADIRKAGEKAASLTGQLLLFSRKKDVAMVPVDLNDVVAEAGRLLRRVIAEDIRVETRVGAGLPPVRAEPGLLSQVLMNLAVNAKDAMPDGGTLTIETSLVTDPDAAGDHPPAVRLTVSDTGCGMDAQTQARLFEPFFTTKGVGKGTGLGLATLYGIIQTLGGKVRVASAVGKGSTFHIDLRPYDAGPPESTVRAEATAVRLDGVSILLVEDNEMVRNLLVQGLRMDGADVTEADDGAAALSRLDAGLGHIDVLITDVVMPGMNGRELAERVRARRPGVKVVFMSGYTADEVVRRGVVEDQVAFVQKPMTPDQLAARVRQVVGPGGVRPALV